MSAYWRFAALAGLAIGLAASPYMGSPGLAVCAIAITAAGLAASTQAIAGLPLLLATVAGLALGAEVGSARAGAIDGAALRAGEGSAVAIRGYVLAPPRRSFATVRVALEAEQGRVLVEAAEPVPDLPVGTEVSARGSLAPVPEWYADTLRRQGIAAILEAVSIAPTGARRGGLRGRLDAIRIRAEEALGRGMPDREAALARGFVLGQDDSIDPQTTDAFRRSGLAHLLAVSGQNVLLLALLATPILAILGIPLRARLLWLIGLIALYVPLAGGGPSIQRAGVMGAAGLTATLAGRPASRLYAVLLAAVATLALNPRAAGDPGWQLSFAAVLGIFAWAAPIRVMLGSSLLAEAAAVTISATLATAPISASHFSSLSLTALPANLLAAPAVAPAMWLGMISAAVGQLPSIPVEPINALCSLFLAYIAQVAEWLGDPGWALVRLEPPSPATVVAAYLAIALVVTGAIRLDRRRAARRSGSRKVVVCLLVAALAGAASLVRISAGGGAGTPPPGGLEVRVLDVGQGDAILLRPGRADPILVDTGPAGTDLADMLLSSGVDSLAAVVITHDQSDHAGGLPDLRGAVRVRRVLFAESAAHLRAGAASLGAEAVRVAEGSEIRSGRLRLEVLWPPREVLAPGIAAASATATDPNATSLVLLARWGRFEMLLTGDTESELAPIDPGPIDVLKVAHHGSEDSGLATLLERSSPRIAVISVGSDNPYGHPTGETLSTLADHGVPVLRTDLDGTVAIAVGPPGGAGERFAVSAGG